MTMTLVYIGNSMVSGAIWEKRARVSFQKCTKLLESEGRVQFVRLQKRMSACLSQISRETILSLDNNF